MKAGEKVQSAVNGVSNVVQEFSRFAHQYDHYNVIQAQVAAKLVEGLSTTHYNNVIDVGCGSGEVYKNFIKNNIDIKSLVTLDSSNEMLALHPSSANITKRCVNFNDVDFTKVLPRKDVDLVISSSALQWSENLDYTISEISKLSHRFNAALFTSGTFKTLHKTADITSPIYSASEIQRVISKYYDSVDYSLHHYTLEFKSTREMFKYIKQSGVSSGERKLNYQATKKLMKEYDLNYLEFEVLFVEGISKV